MIRLPKDALAWKHPCIKQWWQKTLAEFEKAMKSIYRLYGDISYGKKTIAPNRGIAPKWVPSSRPLLAHSCINLCCQVA